MTLHGSGEALALAGSGDVDVCAVLEDLGGELLADLVVGGVRNAELHYVATRGHTSLGELAGSRLVHLARVDGAERELNGAVAVTLFGTDLGYDVRPSLHDGDRDNPVVLVEDLGHAELGAQDSLDLGISHCFCLRRH